MHHSETRKTQAFRATHSARTEFDRLRNYLQRSEAKQILIMSYELQAPLACPKQERCGRCLPYLWPVLEATYYCEPPFHSCIASPYCSEYPARAQLRPQYVMGPCVRRHRRRRCRKTRHLLPPAQSPAVSLSLVSVLWISKSHTRKVIQTAEDLSAVAYELALVHALPRLDGPTEDVVPARLFDSLDSFQTNLRLLI